MKPHMDRVKEERDQLMDRWSRLDNFIGTPDIPGFIFAGLDVAEQTRLRCQLIFMGGYLDILNARIAAVEGTS